MSTTCPPAATKEEESGIDTSLGTKPLPRWREVIYSLLPGLGANASPRAPR
jgi:hypothetical protein